MAKLPSDVVIAEEKLTRYLLVWRARNDECGYLAQAGYESSNWETLDADLRQLARIGGSGIRGTQCFRRNPVRTRRASWSQRRYTKSEDLMDSIGRDE